MNITEENIQEIYDRYSVEPNRAQHSLGVARIAKDLAERNGVDPHKTWLTGALHDIARNWNEERTRAYCSDHNISLNADENTNYKLIHGKIAADILPRELNITDPEIAEAIRYHTSGKANMSTLTQILYVADFIESTLGEAGYQNIRDESQRSLPEAIALINVDAAEYNLVQGRKLSKDFLENMKFYEKYLNTSN